MSFLGVEARLVNNRLPLAMFHQRRISNLWTNHRLNPRLNSTSRIRKRKTRTISSAKIQVPTAVKIQETQRRLKSLSELLWTSATDCSICAVLVLSLRLSFPGSFVCSLFGFVCLPFGLASFVMTCRFRAWFVSATFQVCITICNIIVLCNCLLAVRG